MAFINNVGKFISKIPIIGQAVQKASESFEGSISRAVGTASSTASADLAAQRQFEAQRTAGVGAGFGLGQLLANPLTPIVVVGFLVWILFRRR